MRRISSRQNPLVARYRAAARRETPGVILLDGTRLIEDALASGVRVREVAVAAAAVERPDIAMLLARIAGQGVEPTAATAPVMAALSPLQSASVLVALADRPTIDHRGSGAEPALQVIAVDVQDPGNLGAIARVAEAAGATGLVTAGMSADPFGWKALRGAMGSAFRLPISTTADPVDAVASASRAGCRVMATVPRGGRALSDVTFTGPTAFVIGGEGSGLRATLLDRADERITIPMQAPVESLNAAVATGLLLYEARRQRQMERRPVAQGFGPAR